MNEKDTIKAGDKMKQFESLYSRDFSVRSLEAAAKLCEIYFNIACEVYPEEVVRQKRDDAIQVLLVKAGI